LWQAGTCGSIQEISEESGGLHLTEGDKESVLVAEELESFTTQVIQVPPIPPRMPDRDNPGALIDDRGAMIMWERALCHLPT
jgi:hypothetical protein